jgi:germination protein M
MEMQVIRRSVALACALLVAAPAACGVDEEPAGDERDRATAAYQVWFVGEGALHMTARSSGAAVNPRAAVQMLLNGPSEEEQSAGVSSAIPVGTELLRLETANEIATVDFSPHYEAPAKRSSMRLRLAQVVYTLTQFPSVSAVSMEVGGRPLRASSFKGISVRRPLERSDFDRLLPPIVVDAPTPGAEVHSPIRISGTADVFEATVSIRIRDAEGKRIARAFTTATCGTGCRGAYSTKVQFSVDEPEQGTIEVFEQSMEDGSDLFAVTIPVVLLP